jgi:predicted nucleic acid-binding protein
MILADTGYFIALAKPKDSLHDRAAAWSAQIHEALLVTEYALWETVNYLSFPQDLPKAYILAQHVMNGSAIEFVDASPDLLKAGLEFHRARSDKEWSLTDCISFHLMAVRGITRALAYDLHFQQAGFQALLRQDPPA